MVVLPAPATPINIMTTRPRPPSTRRPCLYSPPARWCRYQKRGRQRPTSTDRSRRLPFLQVFFSRSWVISFRIYRDSPVGVGISAAICLFSTRQSTPTLEDVPTFYWYYLGNPVIVVFFFWSIGCDITPLAAHHALGRRVGIFRLWGISSEAMGRGG